MVGVASRNTKAMAVAGMAVWPGEANDDAKTRKGICAFRVLPFGEKKMNLLCGSTRSARTWSFA